MVTFASSLTKAADGVSPALDQETLRLDLAELLSKFALFAESPGKALATLFATPLE